MIPYPRTVIVPQCLQHYRHHCVLESGLKISFVRCGRNRIPTPPVAGSPEPSNSNTHRTCISSNVEANALSGFACVAIMKVGLVMYVKVEASRMGSMSM